MQGCHSVFNETKTRHLPFTCCHIHVCEMIRNERLRGIDVCGKFQCEPLLSRSDVYILVCTQNGQSIPLELYQYFIIERCFH